MEDRKLILKHEIPLRWVDMDSYNHVNNAKYYDFMTESRALALVEFMNECNFIVSENSCKYKLPLEYPGTVMIEQFVQNLSATSFECIYVMKSSTSGLVHAEGYAKIVCFDTIKRRPCKIPEKLRNFITNG